MAGNPKRKKVKTFSGRDLARAVGKETVKPRKRKKPKKK